MAAIRAADPAEIEEIQREIRAALEIDRCLFDEAADCLEFLAAGFVHELE